MEEIINTTSSLPNSTIDILFAQSNALQDSLLYFFNIFSQIACVVGLILNMLTIIAFVHTPKQFKNESKLFISLSASDMLILFAVLLHEVLSDSLAIVPACMQTFNMILTHTSYLATLLNLTMMSLHLYYFSNHVITFQTPKYKINCMVIFVWVTSVLIPLLEVFVGLAMSKPANENNTQFCVTITNDDFRTDSVIIHGIFIVLFIMVIAYLTIAVKATKKNISVNANKSRTIITTGLFIFTFMIFWIPYGIFHLVLMYKTQQDQNYISNNFFEVMLANQLLTSFFLLNSIADPIIYCLRLRTVRTGFFVFMERILKLCKNNRDRRPYYTSRERRKTVSTTISGQDWLNHDEGSPTMINHDSISNHDDINAASVKSKMILEPLDWVVPDTNGTLETNLSKGCVCDTDT